MYREDNPSMTAVGLDDFALAPKVGVTRSFGRGLRLNAGVFNLTGAEYIEWADVRGRVVGDPLIPYYTRPGRNSSVTLHWRF
jgi:outer membrane receptor protein involved in Fe transport